jgi:hypothetical protein
MWKRHGLTAALISTLQDIISTRCGVYRESRESNGGAIVHNRGGNLDDLSCLRTKLLARYIHVNNDTCSFRHPISCRPQSRLSWHNHTPAGSPWLVSLNASKELGLGFSLLKCFYDGRCVSLQKVAMPQLPILHKRICYLILSCCRSRIKTPIIQADWWRETKASGRLGE